MKKFVRSTLLAGIVSMLAITTTGCAIGEGGLTSSPVFPPSTLDYSSQLDKLQARQGGSPYAPLGGFDDAPTRGGLFSLGSRSRSGSC